jgi:Lrp/AsnC family leucine-responsive transcriptional regulator
MYFYELFMQIDTQDRKILRELHADGRISWVDLAERVNLSPSACQRRVQSLIDSGVIAGFTARIDPAALGYEIEAYLSVRVERHDVQRAKEFRKAIRRYPEVLTCRMMSGDIDFLLRVVATDVRSYGRFVEEKILSLPGVKDASTSIVLDQIKVDSFYPD